MTINTADLANGLLEAAGGLFLYYNCWKTYQAKIVRGYSILSTIFFAVWGFWNVWFYPHLGLWLSFAGGLVIASGNLLWIVLSGYYIWQEKQEQTRNALLFKIDHTIA